MTLPISTSRRTLNELPAWLRQMKAALGRPIGHHEDFARMIDRGVSEIIVKFGGPRI